VIAVITSTLIPSSDVYSFFSVEERWNQTIKTIKTLFESGFESVYLLDNSCKDFDRDALYQQFQERLIISHQKQYTFQNKGINEALLLLNHMYLLPKDRNLFKISGRYFLVDDFNTSTAELQLQNADFVGKGYNYKHKTGLVSTRGYFIKNTEVYENILVKAVEEMQVYGSKIHGLKSAVKSIQNIFTDTLGSPFQISMEQAFARVIKKDHTVSLLGRLGIAGYVAGSDHLELIEE